jgi:hypothetical protein
VREGVGDLVGERADLDGVRDWDGLRDGERDSGLLGEREGLLDGEGDGEGSSKWSR